MWRTTIQFLRRTRLLLLVLGLGGGAFSAREAYLRHCDAFPQRLAAYQTRQSQVRQRIDSQLQIPGTPELIVEEVIGGRLMTQLHTPDRLKYIAYCDVPGENIRYSVKISHGQLVAFRSYFKPYAESEPAWWKHAEGVRTWGLVVVSLLWLVGFMAVAWDRGLRSRFGWLTLNLALLALLWWLAQPPWQIHVYSLWWEHGHFIGAGMIVLTLGGMLWPRRAAAVPDHVSCPTCGYNLTGNLSGICPECGKPTPARIAEGRRALAQSLACPVISDEPPTDEYRADDAPAAAESSPIYA